MEKIAPLLADAEFSFEFKEPANLPNPMLSMQGVSVGYPAPSDAPAGTPPTVIVRNINRSVLAGQRIGILGANGQGKSTLVKTIARDLQAIEGDTTEGKGLNIGYFAQQELDVLHPKDDPLQHMIDLCKRLTAEGKLSGQATREQDLRNFLGQFNFSGDMVKQAVGSMSGGEKARLVLCMLVWQRPNLLLMDEPTNHLDLATREALSMALNEFEGTVMLVSHDRALLRAVCDEFWMVSRGGVEPFDGDLDDYQRYLLDEGKRLRAEAVAAANAATAQAAASSAAASQDAAIQIATPTQASDNATASPAPKSIVSRDQRKEDAQLRKEINEKKRPLKKEFDAVEKSMATLEAEKTALHDKLATPLPPAEIAEAGKRLKAVEDELAELEMRWLELTEAMDAIEAAMA
jgi:ATP-binding cassette subfamily F protein 3